MSWYLDLPAKARDRVPVCLTCSDAAEALRIRSVGPDGGWARAWGPRGLVEVDVTLVGPVRPGMLVLVHGGVALAVVEEGTLDV
ncbi:MAG: sedoheptulose 7-phosphate isomerase [Firmicutes bacterium]|nr:sedoheptulose 7-phosphate isomerase [Bacillota bacterium]